MKRRKMLLLLVLAMPIFVAATFYTDGLKKIKHAIVGLLEIPEDGTFSLRGLSLYVDSYTCDSAATSVEISLPQLSQTPDACFAQLQQNYDPTNGVGSAFVTGVDPSAGKITVHFSEALPAEMDLSYWVGVEE